jgi:hypothetical protein
MRQITNSCGVRIEEILSDRIKNDEDDIAASHEGTFRKRIYKRNAAVRKCIYFYMNQDRHFFTPLSALTLGREVGTKFRYKL